jgi:very-short-patch-repair endonuclease
MRLNPTPSEGALWQRLKDGQLGLAFESQVIIGGRIVDFCCERAKLVVEVDGGYHREPKRQASDAARDRLLADHAYTVLHIPSTTEPSVAVQRIAEKLRELADARPSAAA